MLLCRVCNQVKPLTEFAPSHRGEKRGKCRPCNTLICGQWAKANPDKTRENDKKWKLNRPEQYRASILKAKYGLLRGDYERMSQQQNHVCAVCGKTETTIHRQTGKTRSLAVDHCHDTGKVRGLLCGACNKALGGFNHSVEVLQSAIRYLEETS